MAALPLNSKPHFDQLTPTMCMQLAAPHTWPGPSVLTSVFGGVYTIACGYPFDWVIWCLLACVAVFAQSAVNTLNDWADYRSGTDTAENSDDPTDAVLVYNNLNPKHVLALGIGYMSIAAVCGVACCWWSLTLVPLIIGVIGELFVVIYSSGKVPVSYLPLGEIVSGVVMGLLIPVADVVIFAARTCAFQGPFAVVGIIDWPSLILACVPFVIGIGMVMATQNNCDIERDEVTGRHTLPVMLGRPRSRVVYRIFTLLWIACVLHVTFWYFNAGFWAACVCLVFGSGCIYKLMTTALIHKVRAASMGNVNKANLFINGAYILAIMVSLF